MSAFIYLGLLIATAVAVVVYLDRRWSAYIAGATRTDTIVKVSRAATVVTPKDAAGLDALWLELLTTTAPQVPSQRRPGRDS